ncbi:hypothetical protein QUB80_12130 [Chlorogloeopsis sp. ULAP01]|uniref:hypothetical protein n=1 Tax=Chlorogloeopsis sp. ULAP01 TaxID=3056483 RepID=UPI0025AA3592|nr:hypothetical protein [Chlorogloeopsis sp. ULAP01]MDM9381449.1 hypothetical protein [Chlorogloeopsis sp. ULAP01]
MKKVLGLAILAAFFATPALAGETFVRNEWTNSHTTTKTNLNLDSKTYSTRNEKYESWADKIYVDGDVDVKYTWGGKEVAFDDFTVHTAGSSLYGNYHESNYTKVYGTIHSIMNSYSNAHETTAGVR